jgi:hypothetical protein
MQQKDVKPNVLHVHMYTRTSGNQSIARSVVLKLGGITLQKKKRKEQTSQMQFMLCKAFIRSKPAPEVIDVLL